MKIKIEHISNTYNYGSLMMAVNTISFINSKIVGAEFYVDNQSDDEINRIKDETNYNNILPEFIFGENSGNIFMRAINVIRKENFEKKIYDVRIILGGDDISEYYEKKWMYKFVIMYLKNRFIPTIYLGQTMGPFTGWRKHALKYVIGNAEVFTRDDLNYDYLRKLKIKNINMGCDLAFAKLPNQENINFNYNKLNLEKEKYIVVVPSGLTNLYTKCHNDYISEYCNIIKCLIENSKFVGYKIVLLPHVLYPNKVDDRNVINSIKRSLDIKNVERITIIDHELLASEARNILGNSKFVITGRMHAAVSSFFANTPAISLSYSIKYKGVIGRGLNMEQLIIECQSEKMWNRGDVHQQVIEKSNFIIDNYEEIINEIEVNVTIANEKNHKQLMDVSKILENKYSFCINDIIGDER